MRAPSNLRRNPHRTPGGGFAANRLVNDNSILTTQWRPRGEKVRDNGKRRYAMGDKGKKDKDKGRKQKIIKQEQDAKRALEKLPKTPERKA